MPENAVYVGRPSKWGNIFHVGEIGVPDAQTATDLYEHELLTRGGSWQDKRFDLHELRGKDVCDWCALEQPCHGDVLLRLANQE